MREIDADRMTSAGACSNPDCYFLHIRPEEGKMIRDCPWYTRGFCKLGEEGRRHACVRTRIKFLYLSLSTCVAGPACKSAHRRLQACPAYLAGLCTKGPDCELGQ